MHIRLCNAGNTGNAKISSWCLAAAPAPGIEGLLVPGPALLYKLIWAPTNWLALRIGWVTHIRALCSCAQQIDLQHQACDPIAISVSFASLFQPPNCSWAPSPHLACGPVFEEALAGPSMGVHASTCVETWQHPLATWAFHAGAHGHPPPVPMQQWCLLAAEPESPSFICHPRASAAVLVCALRHGLRPPNPVHYLYSWALGPICQGLIEAACKAY